MRVALSFVLFVAFGLASCVRKEPNADVLVSQLKSGTCQFIFDPETGRCEAVGILASWTTRNFKYRCLADAARCIGGLKFSSALPQLVSFLESGLNDVDTGDGILFVRARVAESVAELGDPRGLSALERALHRNDEAVKAETGAFPSGYVFERGTSHAAIRKAIETLRNNKKQRE